LLFELDYFHLCYFEPQGLLTLLEAVGEPLANILRETSSNGGGPYNVLIDLARLQAPFSLEAVGLVGKVEAGESCRLSRPRDRHTVTSYLRERAQSAGFKTSVDVVSEDSGRFAQIVRPALRHCDYCVLNEFEAERTTGIEIVRGDAVNLDAARKNEDDWDYDGRRCRHRPRNHYEKLGPCRAS
jgi:sugar/nucleoside kinase (ribokinase family)